MERRNFLKFLGLSPMVPGLLTAKPDGEIQDGMVKAWDADYKEAIDARGRYEHIMNFDEPLVSCIEYHDKIYVACAHSIWELYEDYGGAMRRRRVFFV